MIENFLRPPRGVTEITADLLRLLGVVSVVAAAIWASPTDAGILAFALPALVAPRFLGFRAGFDVAICVIVLVAAWSNVFDLYRALAGWDLVMHVVATAALAAMAYALLTEAGVVPRPTDAAFRARTPLVLLPVLGLALSALWEVVEWVGYRFITDTIFVTYDDTIVDMIAGGVGTLLAGVIVARVPLTRAASLSRAGGS